MKFGQFIHSANSENSCDMTKKLVLLFVLLNYINVQMADLIDNSSITETTKEITEAIIKHPIVTSSTFFTANAFATAVNSITRIPFAVSRVLGPVKLTSHVSKTNYVDAVDKFVFDFNAGKNNEDAKMSIDAIIVKYGYSVEIHNVTTEDGYVLTMFRIPSNGSVVFLMHGLIGSADDYIVAGRESGLAYLLAEQGYDVWMGNARGCKHSRRHTSMDPSDASFWDFSWHEIGMYDLPAMIDFVLSKRNRKTLKYIGHSQGTTAFFVMASERPEYNDKISLMVALSPVAFMSEVRSPIVRLLSPGTSILHGVTKSLGLYEFLPDNKLFGALRLLTCGMGPLATILCSNIIFIIAGFDFAQLNVTNLPVIYGHLPSGASIKQFAHYGQGLLSEDFRKFDYGSAENLKRYGVTVAPRYALDRIVAPVSLFYSDADWLAHPSDVNRLRKRLSNVVDMYKIPYKQFNHVDFLFAKDVKTLVYKRLQKMLSLF